MYWIRCKNCGETWKAAEPGTFPQRCSKCFIRHQMEWADAPSADRVGEPQPPEFRYEQSGRSVSGHLAGSAVGEFNGFLLPADFHRYAPEAQAKLIDAIQERWKASTVPPSSRASSRTVAPSPLQPTHDPPEDPEDDGPPEDAEEG
jgi:hypothetical protein